MNSLISDVATSYLQLRDLDLQLEITQKTLESRKESLRLTQTLADAGSVSISDVRQAEQLVYTASAAIPTLQQQIAKERTSSAPYLGRTRADSTWQATQSTATTQCCAADFHRSCWSDGRTSARANRN